MAENTNQRPSGERPAPRRDGMIHCEKCGEYYADTYKRCPFCDERPVRGGSAGGRRAAGGKRAGRGNPRGGGYRGGGVEPLQLLKVILSLVIVIAAIYILVTKVGPLLFGGGDKAPDVKPGTSQVDPDVSTPPEQPEVQPQPQQPGTEDPSTTPEVPEPPKPAAPTVTSLSVNKKDFTLKADESYTLKVKVEPESAAEYLTFTSSDTDIARVSATGTVSNVNSGKGKANTTITVTCGDKSVEVLVFCKGGSQKAPPMPDQPEVKPQPVKPQPEVKPDPKPEVKPQPQQPSPIESGTEGVIYNAEGGLNIRSGPGTENPVVASGENGGIVRILGEENGWYKVDYKDGKIGYVSKDYVKVG